MQKECIRFSRVKEIPGLELYQADDVVSYVPRHIHWVFSLSAVDTGVRIHETRAGKYLAASGSIAVVSMGEVHSSIRPGCNRCSSRSIRVRPELLSQIISQVTGKQTVDAHFAQPVIHDPELTRQVLNLHQVLSCSRSRLEKECRLLDVFAKLFQRYARVSTQPAVMGDERTPVSRVCEYLQDLCCENVSLDELAAIAGLSPFHLSRVFTKEIGVPPHTYQLQRRLSQATNLLALGRPIVEVALETGFCDQSHFHKAFKKKYGITPGQYELTR